jgi:predicted enzyme related to lactoylglutathione lyase
MSRPIHFEIQADDLERAKAFYADVFGWTYDDWSAVTGSPYWGVHTGDPEGLGIDGGLMARPGGSPASGQVVNAAVLTMGVDDFDATAAMIEAAGGGVAVHKVALPGMAWQGYFVDPEGNLFGIHQPDENAA